MQTNKLELPDDQLRKHLLPRLKGTVFHVTTRANFHAITEGGAILSNEHRQFPVNWPHLNESCLRKNGYVSLFDLRHLQPDAIDVVLSKLNFLNPKHAGAKPTFLILDEQAYGELGTPDDLHCSELLWIPKAEIGVKERISISDIRLALHVDIQESEFVRIVREVSRE